jgi:tyrosyl-tRNA synthetase
MRLLSELQSRGLYHQASDPQLDQRLGDLAGKGPIAAYAGFDPTADSLHVGNFVAILGLMYAQRNGIRPIAIVGGATGLIGDPSGKQAERTLQSKETVASNVLGIRRVLEKFLDFSHPTAPARIVNNLDWFGSMSAIDFLRDVGKHFRVGSMMSKDSVRSRMDSADEGMSYTEFSYQLLQGYDFYKLFTDYNCVLQMGGSDQWGNITAGIDVIRKLTGASGQAFGLTFPLITTSSGAKFGKSEGNAVWLTADRTSAYDFYQFWLRTEDADVERYLRLFTFLPLADITSTMAEHSKAPEQRIAQKKLAEQMTTLVHGADATAAAQSAAAVMFGKKADGLDAAAVDALIKQGVPTTTFERERLAAGVALIDAAVDTGLAKSKSDARRLLQQGGLYVNNQQVTDVSASLTLEHLGDRGAIVLRQGKAKNFLIRVKG